MTKIGFVSVLMLCAMVWPASAWPYWNQLRHWQKFGSIIDEDPSIFHRDYPSFVKQEQVPTADPSEAPNLEPSETPSKEEEVANKILNDEEKEDAAEEAQVKHGATEGAKKASGVQGDELTEEQKKLQDIAGRLEVANLEANEGEGDEEKLEGLKEEQEASEAQKLLKKQECIKEELNKLADVAGRALARKTATNSLNEEAAKDEADKLGELKKVAQVEETQSKADQETALQAVETTETPTDELKKRDDKQIDKLSKEEAKTIAEENEDECETQEEVKTYLKKGPQPSSKNRAQLKLEKAEATTEEELANVDDEAAQSDADEATKLIGEATEQTKEAEDEDIASQKELQQPAAVKETMGKYDPCLENKELESQAVIAAKEADTATQTIESANEKLEKALKLAADAKLEAEKGARVAEDAKNDPCENEAHKRLAELAAKKASDLDKKAKELDKAALAQKAKLEELKSKVTNDKTTAEHTAASKMRHKPEECQPHKEACGEEVQPSPNPCFHEEETQPDPLKVAKDESQKEDREIESGPSTSADSKFTIFSSLRPHLPAIVVPSGDSKLKTKDNAIGSGIATQMLSRLVLKKAAPHSQKVAVKARK